MLIRCFRSLALFMNYVDQLERVKNGEHDKPHHKKSKRMLVDDSHGTCEVFSNNLYFIFINQFLLQ